MRIDGFEVTFTSFLGERTHPLKGMCALSEMKKSEDFCEAEITAFKTALFVSFRFQLYSSHHRTLPIAAYANKIKILGECHYECRF